MTANSKAWFKIRDTSFGQTVSPTQTTQKSIWKKDSAKLTLKCSDLLGSQQQLEPTYFSKRTRTLKRLVQRFYYISSNILCYSEKRKSTSIKGQLNLNQVYAEFYESKVPILKNTTYIISLRQDSGPFVELLTENVVTFKLWSTEFRKHCYLTDFGSQFSIIKMIGKGGFARVYLGEENDSRKQYAIKVISKENLLLQPKGIVINQFIKQARSLQNEIQVMRELKDVPGCLKLYGVYVADSSVNLILEYVKGGELVKRLREKDHPYTIENVCSITREILEALAAIHSRNIIHRDLKPENILLANTNNSSNPSSPPGIKIADYGLSTFDSSRVSSFIFKRCGTPGFIAPEVLSTKDDDHKMYTHKVDVFSAGVILFILLSGEQPFVGTTHRQVLELNKKCNVNFSVIDSNPKIPQSAKTLVRVMMEKDPLLRPSARDCLNNIFFSEVDFDNNLSLEFIKYESNRLASADGLNYIPIFSSKNPLMSDNEVYWINPFWKGQTKTIQTESKLSSTQVLINDVRKRNKSNFAPNSPMLLLDEATTSNVGAAIRENRSASLDSDVKLKFSANNSLHVAVLMKNKLGELDLQQLQQQQQQKRSSNVKKLGNTNILRDKNNSAWTNNDKTTSYTINNNDRTPTLGGVVTSLHRCDLQTEPPKHTSVIIESNLEKYNTFEEVKEVSNEDALLAMNKKSSEIIPLSKDEDSDMVRGILANAAGCGTAIQSPGCFHIRKKSKSLPTNYVASPKNNNSQNNFNNKMEFKEENTIVNNCAAGSRTTFEDQMTSSKQECNLNASEADENHCQAIQFLPITLMDDYYFNRQASIQTPTPTQIPMPILSSAFSKNKQFLPQPQLSKKVLSDELIIPSNLNVTSTDLYAAATVNQLPNTITPLSSCLEADFKVNEVEEHISIDHLYDQINRNILFKFNPFNRDASHSL